MDRMHQDIGNVTWVLRTTNIVIEANRLIRRERWAGRQDKKGCESRAGRIVFQVLTSVM